MSDVFLSLTPRSKSYTGCNVSGIPLRVVKGSVDIKPSIKFSATDLNGGQKYYHNNTGDCDSFTISVIIHKDDEFRSYNGDLDENVVPFNIDGSAPRYIVDELYDKAVAEHNKYVAEHTSYFKIIDLLDFYIRRAEPFYVNTRAVGIKGTDLYLVTDQPNRKQAYENYTVWELTFTKYSEVKYAKFNNSNKGVKAAVNRYKKAKLNAKKKALKKTARYKLKKECKLSALVYSKTKKDVKCVRYMQQILVNKGFMKKKQINGWYDKTTYTAVKKFQKKYAKQYKLQVNGKVDKRTFVALYSV